MRIGYELRGRLNRRRPWLVLIQGMGLDRRGWERIPGKLRRRFRLVLVDNRGFGRSDRPAGSFTVADLAGDVVAVLDAAGVRRAHVMGASLGGLVAQELAVGWPERVDGLVLACTAPGWPLIYPMPRASVRLLAASVVMTNEAALRRFTENALAARTVRQRPELVDRLVERQAARPADRRVLRAQAAAGARYAGRLRQKRIQARTLVLHGDADKVVDPRNGRLLARLIPDARLVTFPELGHLLFWEDPDGFAAAVLNFLAPAGPSRGGPRRLAGYLLPRQAGVVRPPVDRAAPRRGRCAAAQLRAGAVRVDDEAGGHVLQRAVRLRHELLPRAVVARGEDQAVAQRIALPAAAGI
jgi:3-oxoadipate enol-lactonase